MDKSYKEICAEIEILQKQAETARQRECAEAIVEIKRLVREFGLSAADCGFVTAGKLGPQVKRRVAIRYQHPEKRELTWSGRGKLPNWLRDEEANGRSREIFRV
ncbi:MAG: H-NS histone family protein [Rhodocyclales bacterium]|nr:H-NS histone family protein [Rhodocyclales bacterium]